MRIYRTNKTILHIQNNAAQFLNGITSNSLDAVDNAFLNIHGRIVATFDQVRIGEDEFLICIVDSYVEKVLEHIDKYVKLSGVKVHKPETAVYFDLENDVSLQPPDHGIEQKAGKLVLTGRVLEPNVTDEEFRLFRLRHNIPWQGTDYTDEMLLNVSMDRFISFKKGCFLGQEPVSKVYNRSKPTWRLEVKCEDQLQEEEKPKMTSRTLDPQQSKYIGFIFVKNV